MRELVELAVVVLVGVLVFTLLVVAPIYAGGMVMEKWQCGKYQEATGKQTKYIGAECYVMEDGKWFAWSEYKNRLIAAGSMK